MSRSFVHLHCHTHYSLLDGAGKIPSLVKQAKELGMNSLAITDHGNLFGAIEFYEECKKHGLNPVIGYEAYVAPGARTDRSVRSDLGNEASFHLTMLAQNRTGVKNLIKMASAAFLEGFYYRPRIDKELLEAYGEGLIILSGCAAGEMSTFILNDRMDEATRLAEWFAKRFGDRFYMEIQDNGLEIQKRCAAATIEIAEKVGLPLVATCDSHYLCSDDAEAHEVLLCVNTGKVMSDPKRMQYGSREFYLKSPEEMYTAFQGRADAVQRSQEIADRVDIDLDFKTRHFPIFVPPVGKTDRDYLRELCEQGLERRYPVDGSEKAKKRREEAKARLEHELGIIERLNFCSYFLIVWDFVRFAHENGIAAGARGSACGTIVSYLLGFSNVCPLEYDLLFERFLDPSRAEAPDIDIDFDQNRRDEVIEYVRKKYGEKNVSQIITFNTLAARAVLKDVARALEMPLSRVDGITKQIPTRLKITLDASLKEVPELRAEYDRDPDVKRLFDIGRKLEGLVRNPGVHAAGVVVADQDLTEYVPLTKSGDVVTTQWKMGDIEKVGILKFDFLGLRNLTLLTAAINLIRKTRDPNLDLEKLPLDDLKTYQLLQRGETKGVFQLEGEGIRNLLVKLKPDRFTDIIALCALYRPGPLGGGMVDRYINVKHDREEAVYEHPVMKDVLEETYGVMVYQEQVMRILNRLGGIELASAYKSIKAISKKNHELIAKSREQFVEGARSRGIPHGNAEAMFELIERFADYGFNKSHSTAYALVAYQTAYLKAHYPAEFMAALLSSESDKTDLLVEHLEDCKRMGLTVRPPDVNEGEVDFMAAGNLIRFGLLAIKGVGQKAVEAIVEERTKNGPFRSIFDFCERIDHRAVPKSCVEGLVKAGAFDSFKAKRRQLFEVLPTAFQAGTKLKAARDAGQEFMFGGDDETSAEAVDPALPDLPEWSDKEKLGYEKSLLGVYLSSHPLVEYDRRLRVFRSHSIAELGDLPPRKDVVVGGIVSQLRLLTQKSGRNANMRYARFAIEDLSGHTSCVMFADAYALYGGRIAEDAVVFLKAQTDSPLGGGPPTADGEPRKETVSLLVNEVIRYEDAQTSLAGSLVVRVDGRSGDPERLRRVANILKGKPGPSPLYFEIMTDGGLRVRMRASDNTVVCCDNELIQMLEDELGPGSVSIGRNMNGNGKSNGAPPPAYKSNGPRPYRNGQPAGR
jgi:DNA polymerase III subunit alpha